MHAHGTVVSIFSANTPDECDVTVYVSPGLEKDTQGGVGGLFCVIQFIYIQFKRPSARFSRGHLREQQILNSITSLPLFLLE